MTVSNAPCLDASDAMILTIYDDPTADAGAPTAAICEAVGLLPGTYLLDATATTSVTGTILWTSSGDGTFNDATIEDPIYTPGTADIAGTNTVVTLTMTVSNAPCADATD